ncbi:hypothetical protein ACFJGX_01180 [Hydrogenophaga sp. UC242_50]|uniref:hypothetical protein n=1 Tax=unclassified Hydrogenophaga TaxID=2610897 RepID=UPI0036D31652
MVEHLGQGMGLGQIHRELGHGFREQAFQRAGDAGELRVAPGEVVHAVELIQKEAGRGGIHRVLKEVGVRGAEAPGLQPFHLVHRPVEACRAGLLAQITDTRQVRADAVGGAGVLGHRGLRQKRCASLIRTAHSVR